MRQLKQSGTRPLLFLMIDSVDHIAGKTGLTPTVTISKDGAAFAAPAGAVAEIANGWYKLTPTSADSGTLGTLVLHATGTGADPVDDRYQVVSYDPEDAAGLGLSRLDVAISTRGTSTYAGGAVASVTGNIGGNIVGNLLGTLSAAERTAIGDALLDGAAGVETGLTLRQCFRLIASVLFGKVSGMATSAPIFRDFNDTKPRVSAVTDAFGNRTTVTRDAT